jgi:hypothetical protein
VKSFALPLGGGSRVKKIPAVRGHLGLYHSSPLTEAYTY